MTQLIDIVETTVAETAATEDFLTLIDPLANQAAEAGYYGLQDACLLVMEALNERLQSEPPTLSNDLKLTLQGFPLLVEAYLQKSTAAAESIAKLLRHADLNVPLIEEEQIMIAQTLIDDIAVTDNFDHADSVLNDATQPPVESADTSATLTAGNSQALSSHLATIEYCADHAAASGQYGLQDVCLLVIDAINTKLHDEAAAVTPELLTLLDSLPSIVAAYEHEPQAAIEDIFKVLGHPELNIQLSDDEITMLESLLTESIVAVEKDQDQHDNLKTDAHSHVVTSATRELVELLVMEAQLVDTILAEFSTDDALNAHLESLTDELDRYINASNIAGFTGLAQICEHIQSNVNHFYQDTTHFTESHHQLLQDWLNNVKSYLSHFNEDDAGLALIAQLSDPQWPIPLTADTALVILQQIRSTNLNADNASSPQREQVASAEDVSLQLPDDVNQELLDILLQELPVYTQEFSEAIHHLQQGGSTEDIDIAQRIAHTLKGSANTVGIGGIATITHHLEDILEACAKANRLPSKTLVNMLIDAADCLEGMSDFLIGHSHEAPAGAQQVLQEVLDWANQIDQHGLQDSEDTAPSTEKSALLDRLAHTEVTAEHEADVEATQQSQQAAIRVPSEQIDALLRMSGESLILNSQANERLRRIKNQLLAMDTQFKTLQRLSDELEQLIDIKDLTGRTLTNTPQDFDSLEMDQYNELYTTSRRLIEAAFDAQEMNFDARNELEQMGEVLEYQQRLVIDTQGAIMQTRLVPVATIASRLQRTLRQTCRLTGKHSNLTLSGEHLMIDSDVLNSIIDPLMHILRNAVDHGLESDAERLAAGKSKLGNINIEFDREGNNILVRCRDDGRGLDFDAIHLAAITRGVIQPGQDVTEEELKRFILRPNFSTRTESTQTSGRGVGMNAVHFQVMSLGGTLALHSKYGEGLAVELRMPLPISRSHTLLAMAGTYRVAIASKGLKQILYAVADDFFTVDDAPMLRLDDIVYPVTTLNKLLRVAENRKKNQRHSAVLLIEQDEKISAVVLDSIVDSLDIVIKDFGSYIKKIPGYIGAAIMGDGAIAPVLDVPELLRLSAEIGDAYVEPIEMLEPGALLPKVLVVDDSLSQRRSLEQLLSDAGFAVHIARDGIEAVELLAEFTPDIMLTDLEMPRMNGIELTAHVRTQTLIKTLPIIMITSRTTQKHHKMAEDAGVDFYIAKPVREDDLLTKIQHLLENKALQKQA